MAFECEGMPALPTLNTYLYPLASQSYESLSEPYSGSSSPETYQMPQTINYTESELSPYPMLPYGNPQIQYVMPAEKIPLEYIGSTSLETADQINRRASSKGKVSAMHLRRRAQNRASQRAFRERKEKHVKGLENQLQALHEQHQNLLQSYNAQVNEVETLRKQVQELLRLPGGLPYSDASLSPVSSNDDSSQRFTSPHTRIDMPNFSSYPSPEPCYHKATIQIST